MKINGILETAIYVDNIKQSIDFYTSLFDFEVMVADDRFCAMSIRDGQVFLLFKKGGTTQPIETPFGIIPPHDGQGTTHFAFSIPKSDLAQWEISLKSKNIPIESKVSWESGSVSLYFRDPDHHLIELATPGLWKNY